MDESIHRGANPKVKHVIQKNEVSGPYQGRQAWHQSGGKSRRKEAVVEASLREAQRRRRKWLCRCVLVTIPKGAGWAASAWST